MLAYSICVFFKIYLEAYLFIDIFIYLSKYLIYLFILKSIHYSLGYSDSQLASMAPKKSQCWAVGNMLQRDLPYFHNNENIDALTSIY